jgi:hypothetical protein
VSSWKRKPNAIIAATASRPTRYDQGLLRRRASLRCARSTSLSAGRLYSAFLGLVIISSSVDRRNDKRGGINRVPAAGAVAMHLLQKYQREFMRSMEERLARASDRVAGDAISKANAEAAPLSRGHSLRLGDEAALVAALLRVQLARAEAHRPAGGVHRRSARPCCTVGPDQ